MTLSKNSNNKPRKNNASINRDYRERITEIVMPTSEHKQRIVHKGLPIIPIPENFHRSPEGIAIRNQFGADGVFVYYAALNVIFGEYGYYADYNNYTIAEIYLLCYSTPTSKIEEIIEFCVELGIFDKDKFYQKQILTSDKIKAIYRVLFKQSKKLKLAK
jgi:hypothetical protein